MDDKEEEEEEEALKLIVRGYRAVLLRSVVAILLTM